MSATPHDGHSGHGHAEHGHGHAGHGDAAPHGTLKSYLTGFGLSVILTAIPFWLVMTGVLGDRQATAMVVVAMAIIQILVHMVYFLHMDVRSESGWTVMALIFTLVLVGIAISGSLWVMYHLTANMAPTPADVGKLP
jgi:cytochrome o ubiquinol oxidase operon protein cyoD